MKVLTTGGTGFVGTQLTSPLIQDDHEVTILTRSLKGVKRASPGISYIEGDPTKKGRWQEAIKDHDAVINLAGAPIFSRWTEEHKKAIRESRVNTTRNIVEGIPSYFENPFTFISTSAVGYYGFHGDEELNEDSPPGADFLARIAVEWEEEALKAKDKGVRVVITRFGIVMGEKGGALSQMIPLFKKYIGGPIGSG
ncbi:MAG: NAD-dependent epimerase/dehydratase family protein, partial [Thermodesulfobacteriota bacterium]